MATTFLLIRHATHSFVEQALAGHMPAVHLSQQGRQQAEQLAARLAAYSVAAVYSSPLERAVETATPLAARLGLPVTCRDGFVEIDFGEWAGKPFAELAGDSRWQYWNSFRSGSPLPSGGLMLEVQARAVAGLRQLQQQHPAQVVAVVSHGDVIKAAIAHYLGMPLDLLQRIEIRPASVSTLVLHPWGAQVVGLNDTGSLPALP